MRAPAIRSIANFIAVTMMCAASFAGTIPAAIAKDFYGAIAVSPSTLKYGWSANKTTLEDAKAEAEKACAEKDCKAHTYYWNGCGGIAYGDSNAWGSHWAADKGGAEKEAIKACQDYGTNCRLEWITCSLGEEETANTACADSASSECGSQCRNDVICQTACVRRKMEACQK